MEKIERIKRALDLNGIMSTSEIAEHSGVPFNEAENILIDMEEIGTAFNIDGDSWKLNE